MKCKSCNGQYKTKELVCPYCGTENLLGKLWCVQRSEAELAYEKERENVKKQIVSPYMLNRLVNRCLIMLAILYIAFFTIFVGGAYVIFKLQGKTKMVSNDINKEEVEKQMETFFEAGDLSELEFNMSEKDVEPSEYYTYTQATKIWNSYSRYMENRLFYDNWNEEDVKSLDYYLEFILEESVEVYTCDYGAYSELDENNEELYQMCKKEIMAYWVGTLKLTEEEIQSLITQEHSDSDEIDKLMENIIERRDL